MWDAVRPGRDGLGRILDRRRHDWVKTTINCVGERNRDQAKRALALATERVKNRKEDRVSKRRMGSSDGILSADSRSRRPGSRFLELIGFMEPQLYGYYGKRWCIGVGRRREATTREPVTE